MYVTVGSTFSSDNRNESVLAQAFICNSAPFHPNPSSLSTGKQIYAGNCQTCHGELGRGDGPAAPGLDPPPADLVVHVPLHPEHTLFNFVHDGIPGTGMAPLGDKLSDEEIWHVINHIKTFE